MPKKKVNGKSGKIEVKMKANAKTPTQDYAIEHIYFVSKKEYELIKLSCIPMKEVREYHNRMKGNYLNK